MLQIKKKSMKDYIINLSKKYSIVTQFTSFIAVEKREKVKSLACWFCTLVDLLHILLLIWKY